MKVTKRNKKSYSLFLLTLAAISLMISSGFHVISEKYLHGFDLPLLFEAFMSLGLFFVFYALFEKHLWKIKFLRCLGIVDFPDVSGRWVGFLTSSYRKNGQNVVVPITLEIAQDASSVLVHAYFERAQSDSVIADFEIINNKHFLCYVYDNAISTKLHGALGKDKGVVMLEYLEEDNRMLKGKYFNNVEPQSNHGEIQVLYSGPKLLGCKEG